MVFLQKWPFLQLFLLGNIGLKNVFYHILERKNAFLGYKKRSSKSQKINIFSKGLTHRFGLNIVIFTTSFKGNIGQENVSYEILKLKKPLSKL